MEYSLDVCLLLMLKNDDEKIKRRRKKNTHKKQKSVSIMVDKNLEMQLRERQSKLKRVSKHLKSNTHTYIHRKKTESKQKTTKV